MNAAIINGKHEAQIRVLIIDGHEAVRRALRIRLSAPDHLEVVGASPDPDTALIQIREEQPDVVILGLHSSSDEEMFQMVGAVRDLSEVAAVVIVLVPYVDAVERELLMNAGAKRYLLKHINSDQLIQEIEMAIS